MANKEALEGMTAQDVRDFLAKVRDVQDTLIIIGMEFLNRTGQGNYDAIRSYWRDDWHFSYADSDDEAYCIVYEETWQGETDYTDYYIPYQALDDMDGAVADFLKEKAQKEEEARQKKLAEEQAREENEKQAEYEEYLRLKEKFEK